MPRKGDTISPELKAKMAEGRRRAAERRHALSGEKSPPEKPEVSPELVAERAKNAELKAMLEKANTMISKLADNAARAAAERQAREDSEGLDDEGFDDDVPELMAGDEIRPSEDAGREALHSRTLELRDANMRETYSTDAVYRYTPPEGLRLPAAPPGIRYRWISDSDGDIDYRFAEGWRYVMGHEVRDQSFTFRKQADGTVRFRQLILMQIPVSMVEQRDAHVAQQSRAMLSGANQLQGIADKRAPVIEEDRSRTLTGQEAVSFFNQ